VEIDSQRKNLSCEPGHGRNRARKNNSQAMNQFADRGTRAESRTKRANAIASSSKKDQT
jgi:hypothetical protein